MKICIDLTALADNFSGIERYALRISRNLIENVVDNEYVLVFKGEVHSEFCDALKRDNVKSVVLKPCKKLMFNLFRLPKELKKIKADYYLFLAFPAPPFFNKKNSIVTIHDLCCWDCPQTMTLKSKLYFRFTISHSVKIARKIITVSEFSKNRIISKFGCKADKVKVAYDGLEYKFLNYNINCDKDKAIDEKYGLPDKYILSLSTIEPRKNIKMLISAYNELISEGYDLYDLVLAGRMGWKSADLLDGIDEKVKSKIKFTGFIDDNDLPYIYSHSSVFVFPSIYEGFGLPPLEALACGALVLSSNAASLPEVLGDAVIYFANKDVEDLKQKLIYCLFEGEDFKEENHDSFKAQANKFIWSDEAKKISKEFVN